MTNDTDLWDEDKAPAPDPDEKPNTSVDDGAGKGDETPATPTEAPTDDSNNG